MAFYGIAINMKDMSGNLHLDLVILTIIDLVCKMSIIGTTKWYVNQYHIIDLQMKLLSF